MPGKDPFSRFVQHGGVVAARVTLDRQHQLADLLAWHRLQSQCLAKRCTLLLNPIPEYFFSRSSRLQFLASRSWRFSLSSLEKSIVVFLLVHHTFLEPIFFFFSTSEIFINKFDFFSMKIP